MSDQDAVVEAARKLIMERRAHRPIGYYLDSLDVEFEGFDETPVARVVRYARDCVDEDFAYQSRENLTEAVNALLDEPA